MRMVVDDSKRCGGPDSPRQEENVLAVRRTPLRPVVVVELLYSLVVGIGLDHRGHGDDARSAVLPAGDDGVEDEALGGSASSLLEDLSVGPKVRILVEGIVDDPLPGLQWAEAAHHDEKSEHSRVVGRASHCTCALRHLWPS